MASLNNFASSITGTTGSVGLLAPMSGWRVFVCPRGIHVKTAGSASPIVADSADAASRITASDWFQVGTNVAKIRQCSAVSGNSFAYSGAAISVTAGDRIVRIGASQPVVSGLSATYAPDTAIYDRDDDAATALTNSMITSDSNGGIQFWAADDQYDAIVQDNNQVCQQVLEDIAILRTSGDLIPDTPYTRLVGNTAFPWGSIYHSGEILTGITGAAGATYHGFDTTGGWTQGNLFGFALNNVTKVYGDTHGGIFQSWTLPEVFNVKSARFGAKGDGTTDDTTAIQNAITAATGAADGAGGIVLFPPGIYIVNSALTITSRVTLRGSGDRITVIRAGGSFTFNGTTDAVVKIGTAGTDAYATVEKLQIDCNNIASSIAMYFVTVQERSGPRDCTFARFRVAGIRTAAASANQNISIMDCDFYFSASSSTAYGIYLDTVAGISIIDNCTFVCYDGVSQSTNAAIYITASGVDVRRIHAENHATGVQYATNSTGIVDGLYGHATVNKLLFIGQAGVLGRDITPGGATYTIWDTIQGLSSTQNSGGWWYLSNDGNAGQKSFLTSDTAFINKHYGPWTFGVTHTHAGTVIGSSYALLTQVGGVLTLGSGNLFGVSGTAVGITGIAPLTEGRQITLIGVLGNQVFTDGAGLDLASGTNKTIANQERWELFCIGTTWYQKSATVTTS